MARVHLDARQRIERVLRAGGHLRDPGDEPAPVKGAEASLLRSLRATSVQTKVAAGENAGRWFARSSPGHAARPSARDSYRDGLERPRGASKAERDGYSSHAATRIAAGRRADLEDPRPDYPTARTVRRPFRDQHPEDPPERGELAKAEPLLREAWEPYRAAPRGAFTARLTLINNVGVLRR